MKYIKNILFSLLLSLFLHLCFFAGNALAQNVDDDINTDPLFSEDKIYYQPISPKDLETTKVIALKEKDKNKMYTIGMMYRDGQGVDADMVQAEEWFKSAAVLGHSDSMVELARLYSLDPEFTGLEKSELLAKKWIEEAERRNNAKAFYTIGVMYEGGFPYERSYEKSLEYYKKAAQRGILNAYVKLYIAYLYGKGVDPDLQSGIYWLRKIQNEAPEGRVKEYAKKMLSEIYFELAVKEQSPALKFKLFNLAWSNGNRYAIEAIGDMFQNGIGVKQNYSSAIVAYETAIKNYESVYAMERLGFIYIKGPAEIDKDYQKAYDLFKKATELGGITASYMLGYMYFYGLGVEKDPKEADIWFKRSTELASNRKKATVSVGATYERSSAALKNLLKQVSSREKERERNERIEDRIKNNTENNNGEIEPLPDIPKY